MAGSIFPDLFIETKSCLSLDGWPLMPLHHLQTRVFSVISEFPHLMCEETGYTASHFLMKLGSGAHKYVRLTRKYRDRRKAVKKHVT